MHDVCIHHQLQALSGLKGRASCRNGIQVSEVMWRWMIAQMMDRAVREQRCANWATPAS